MNVSKQIHPFTLVHTIFRYIIRRPADKQWGVQDENGSFNGMVGDLQIKVSTIHIAKIFINFRQNERCLFAATHQTFLNV